MLVEYSNTYRHLLNSNFRDCFERVGPHSFLPGHAIYTGAVCLHDIYLLLSSVQNSNAHVLVVFVGLLFDLCHGVP